jgi:peroxiredoxin
MSVRKLVSILSLVMLAASSLPAQAPVPRKSPEFTIAKPSGEQILLSSFKGQVVVIEFLFVGSAHCIQLTQMLDRLQGDLGSRGFQAVAIAFGQHSDQAMVGHVADHLKLGYPLGYSTSDQVDSFLGRQGSEKIKIPQMIVIDRKGVIRAATGGGADTRLEDEAALRTLVDPLLKETVSAPASKPKSQQ